MRRRDFVAAPLAIAAAPVLQAATVPRPSPEFTIQMPNGRPAMQLSQHKGKVIALEFLLTTCPHCQKASQALDRIYRQLAPKGFVVVGVAVNQNPDIAAFVKQFNLSFPVGIGDYNASLGYLEHSTMMRLLMPQLELIDRTFTIREHYPGDNPIFDDNSTTKVTGEQKIRARIEALLGSAPAAPKKAVPKKAT